MGLAGGVVGEAEICAHQPIEGALGGGVEGPVGVGAGLDCTAEAELLRGFEARPAAGLIQVAGERIAAFVNRDVDFGLTKNRFRVDAAETETA